MRINESILFFFYHIEKEYSIRLIFSILLNENSVFQCTYMFIRQGTLGIIKILIENYYLHLLRKFKLYTFKYNFNKYCI